MLSFFIVFFSGNRFVSDICTDQIRVIAELTRNDLNRQRPAEAGSHRFFLHFVELLPDLFDQRRLSADPAADGYFFKIQQPAEIEAILALSSFRADFA